MTDTARKPFIAVNLTPALSGYFATLYTWSQGEAGVNIHGEEFPAYWFPEPEATGLGRYATWAEANAEGAAWAEREGLEFVPATAERVAKAEAESNVFRSRIARIKELREQGHSLRDAMEQAKAEQEA